MNSLKPYLMLLIIPPIIGASAYTKSRQELEILPPEGTNPTMELCIGMPNCVVKKYDKNRNGFAEMLEFYRFHGYDSFGIPKYEEEPYLIWKDNNGDEDIQRNEQYINTVNGWMKSIDFFDLMNRTNI